ncbi:Guanine nucleotide exchange protein smcr8a [Nymphon striatum]|nr:Guanine nucleotide exchange protein smcr8a [Nymphon striatum]
MSKGSSGRRIFGTMGGQRIMLNGYSEVAAFQQNLASSWQDEENLFSPVHTNSWSSRSRPAHFSVELDSVYPISEPWPLDCDKISSDFIMVIEFCEVDGPKPTITIPSHLKCALDLNNFALRILSSDYQGAESCLPTEDAQGLLPDVLPGIHAYVHYITLSDIQSRGYVHPMCLSYVTVDNKKLFDQFENIRNQLLIVSSHLKYGSKLLFKRELGYKLEDLLYTKGCYITYSTKSQTTEKPPPVDADSNILSLLTLETLQSNIEEVENVLVKLDQSLNEESIIEERLGSYSLILDKPSLIKPSNSTDEFKSSRNLIELCGQHAIIGLYFLYKTFKMFSKKILELYLEKHHTVLPHMEQVPSNLYSPSVQTDDIKFWESVKCNFSQAASESSSEEDLSSSFSSEVSSSDSISPTYKDAMVSFSSSLEYLNSNLFATIHSLNEYSPGYGISEVFRIFPCGQHILYSLLMSRLLVIVGKPQSENQVRKVVQALQPLIVPFTCPALVIPWRKESLKVTDLGLLQLVGLCHSNNQCLTSIIPDSMKGKLLYVFENNTVFLNDDVTLLSCINSVIFDIVLKTRIYYYHQLEAESSIQNKRSHGHDEDNDKLFFRQMSNSSSDIGIIKHLVEVMKNETINKLKSINRHSVRSEGSKTAPVIRIRHEKVSVINYIIWQEVGCAIKLPNSLYRDVSHSPPTVFSNFIQVLKLNSL